MTIILSTEIAQFRKNDVSRLKVMFPSSELKFCASFRKNFDEQ